MLFYICRFTCITFLTISVSSCFNVDRKLSKESVQSSGFSIKGVSVVAPVNAIDSNALLPIVAINANSIAIMPYAFCSPENPVIRYNHKGQWWGESDEGVIGSIVSAHKKNLSVMLKPHMWIAHGTYTGSFTLQLENEWKLWEESYKDYILHFAKIADSIKAEIFCMGTELGATIKARPQFWNTLIDSIKKIYHGKLTYAANWDDYKEFPFWEKLDYIGVDAYFPLSAEETPSTVSIRKGWSKYMVELERKSLENKHPILFTEYGYRNVDHNCAEPWKEDGKRQNDEAQKNAMEAFYQSFEAKKWFAGGFVWKWYVDEGRHRREDIDFTPQNKPAAKVIERWYRD